jgi:uncharacterized OB-fold protein
MGEAAKTLLPKISSDVAPFWQGCKERRLLLQKCLECGHVRHPASFLCPECLSASYDWIESRGKGKIYSFVVFYRAFHPAVVDKIPYVVAVVELDEGPSILTNVVGCSANELSCEQRVQLKWEDLNDQVTLPIFESVAEEG